MAGRWGEAPRAVVAGGWWVQGLSFRSGAAVVAVAIRRQTNTAGVVGARGPRHKQPDHCSSRPWRSRAAARADQES